MPSSIIHRCVSKRVLEKRLSLSEEDIYFYDIGSVAPDCWRNSYKFKNSELPKKLKRMYSHFSTSDSYIENYDIFYNKYKNKLDNPFLLGYFIHLITDNYWRMNMFYKYFCPDNTIRFLDGSVLELPKDERKALLKNESKGISRYLCNYFRLKSIKVLDSSALKMIPQMNEIEFDGLNDTIIFGNNELDNSNDYNLVVYDKDDFVQGVEKCSDFIIEKLIEYKVIKR